MCFDKFTSDIVNLVLTSGMKNDGLSGPSFSRNLK